MEINSEDLAGKSCVEASPPKCTAVCSACGKHVELLPFQGFPGWVITVGDDDEESASPYPMGKYHVCGACILKAFGVPVLGNNARLNPQNGFVGGRASCTASHEEEDRNGIQS